MFKEKIKAFFTNRYTVYAFILLAYLVGTIGCLVLDYILVETGDCFIVAWNIIFAWSIVRYYQNKWIIQLNKTRFFNFYLLCGLLIIIINLAVYIGPADFHSPINKYIVNFISCFSFALAEEVIFRSYTNETFRKNDQPHRVWKIFIIVPVYTLFVFLRETLSSFFIDLIAYGEVSTSELLTTTLFWDSIINDVIFAAVFGLFLYSIYRKTNLSTCVIIHFTFFVIQEFAKLSVSVTYLPEVVSTICLVVMLVIMIVFGIFFLLYKKKLPKNLEYEVTDALEASKDIENK